MAKGSTADELVCVHCGKPFHSEVLAPDTEHAGFKCPHCRLYMPLERVEENGVDAASV
jgi:DNA-directed RNA polymerase subunit RPC12/RpoP